jgi:hypothetical protein
MEVIPERIRAILGDACDRPDHPSPKPYAARHVPVLCSHPGQIRCRYSYLVNHFLKLSKPYFSLG